MPTNLTGNKVALNATDFVVFMQADLSFVLFFLHTGSKQRLFCVPHELK